MSLWSVGAFMPGNRHVVAYAYNLSRRKSLAYLVSLARSVGNKVHPHQDVHKVMLSALIPKVSYRAPIPGNR